MSDIPSNREKIQQEAVDPSNPVSQYVISKIGGSLNEILDGFKKIEEHTVAGVYPWTATITGNILIEACGGGGGGGCYGGGSPPYGPGGGAGCKRVFRFYPVVKGTIYSINVGAGGAGAPNGGAGVGGTGGNTTFDGVIIAKGAAGGSTASGSFTNGRGGEFGSSAFNKGGDGLETTPAGNWNRFGAGNSEAYSGGAYGGNNGGGGASSYGNGGNGSISGTGQAGQGNGAGGGASGNTGPGGAGADGYFAIYYV